MEKQKIALRYNVPGDFNGELIYQLPDFDLEYIGEKPYKDPYPIGPSHIFVIRPRGESTVKYLSWNNGTGLITPFRFELNGKKFVFDIFTQHGRATLRVWENEKFEGEVAMDGELKDKNPLNRAG